MAASCLGRKSRLALKFLGPQILHQQFSAKPQQSLLKTGRASPRGQYTAENAVEPCRNLEIRKPPRLWAVIFPRHDLLGDIPRKSASGISPPNI